MASEDLPLMRGYNTVRLFAGMALPVPLQNQVMRDYAAANGFRFGLPTNEHKYNNCYMQLFAAMATSPQGGDICMCSLFILPSNHETYWRVAEAALDKGLTFHFIFERMTAETRSEFEEIRDIIKLRAFADQIDACKASLMNEIAQALPL